MLIQSRHGEVLATCPLHNKAENLSSSIQLVNKPLYNYVISGTGTCQYPMLHIVYSGLLIKDITH